MASSVDSGSNNDPSKDSHNTIPKHPNFGFAPDSNMRRFERQSTVDLSDFMARGQDETVDVFIAVHFLKISRIHTKEQHFDADVEIRARWTNDDLPNMVQKAVHEGKMEIDVVSLWKPKLVIINLSRVHGDRYQEKFSVIKDLSGRYNILQTIMVSGSFFERMELHDFPNDIQDLNVTVGSELSDKVVLKKDDVFPSRINRSHFQEEQAWRLYRHVEFYDRVPTAFKSSWTDLVTCCADPEALERKLTCQSAAAAHDLHPPEEDQPQILTAVVRVGRRTRFYFWNTYIIMGSLAFLAPCAYTIQEEEVKYRLAYLLTLLLVTVTFKLSAASQLPPVQHLTFLDYYIICIMLFEICNILLVAIHYYVLFNVQHGMASGHVSEVDAVYLDSLIKSEHAASGGEVIGSVLAASLEGLQVRPASETTIVCVVVYLVLFNLLYFALFLASARKMDALNAARDARFHRQVARMRDLIYSKGSTTAAAAGSTGGTNTVFAQALEKRQSMRLSVSYPQSQIFTSNHADIFT